MSGVAQQLLNGVLLGGYYALLACGLSFMFGVMRIINLAHGDLAILGALLVFVVADKTDISPFLLLLAMIPVMGAFRLGPATRHAGAQPALRHFGAAPHHVRPRHLY